MNSSDDLRLSALRAARAYAGARRLHIVIAFGDTLAGDLARLQVFRRMRQQFPTTPRFVLEDAVEELLTP